MFQFIKKSIDIHRIQVEKYKQVEHKKTHVKIMLKNVEMCTRVIFLLISQSVYVFFGSTLSFGLTSDLLMVL